MPHIGAPELILVLVLALIIFGPGKLPELGKAVGKTIREFRRSSQEIINEVETSANIENTDQKQLVKAAKS
ncbi:MAG: twin-arginine translocase TatA/TatE family subunit [Pelotomaculum sp.]|uniref:Sec-independent protein translocase protein TatA n=1 Tax=Pelotomaculum thermopropionicum (strain DSM 13744 / JCM 10971 / SI) TaxID=370438 RepID=A5D1I4_PELTS|nr:twin-arginine translocase TatA/TatE family subunit [Pelotomaculum sp.]BAF59890.1 Sec-independent protein secretion pathway components [Pelotomaculum thermopropionicum SI]